MFQKPWAESTPRTTSSSFTSKLPPFPSPTRRHCLPGHTLISFSHCVKTARTASGTPTTQHKTDPEISQKSPLYRHTHTRARHRIPCQVRGAAEFPRRAAPSFQKPLPKPHPKHQPNRTPQIAIALSLFLFRFWNIPNRRPTADRIEPVPRNHPAAPKVKPDQDSQSLKHLLSSHTTPSLCLSGFKSLPAGRRTLDLLPGIQPSPPLPPQGKLPRKYVLTNLCTLDTWQKGGRSLVRCGSFVIAGVDPGKQCTPTIPSFRWSSE